MFKKPRLASLVLVSTVLIGLFLSACGSSNGTTAANCPSISELTGAGSTFDNPLFSQMFAPYGYPKAKCGTNVNYDSVGSGKGISQLLAHAVDFGATDTPLTDEQLKSVSGNIIHVPVTLGAVAIAYNLNLKDNAGQDFTGHLNLTPAILASIYLGTITSWDDAAIEVANPNVTLPKQNITVVHRSDESGTTAIFSHYLSEVDTTWSLKVGSGTTVNWPFGVGDQGSGGVIAAVQTTAGSIGYVELEYVLSNGLSYAAVTNANGKNVLPSSDGAKAAATGVNVTNIPSDLRFFIVNVPGDASYPISGFSWVIVYQHQPNASKGQAIANMLWWMIHNGQQYSDWLNYAPLPPTIVTKAEAQIKSMTCGASKVPCYTGTIS
jgi:phosphate transport system substrate-binding protein